MGKCLYDSPTMECYSWIKIHEEKLQDIVKITVTDPI